MAREKREWSKKAFQNIVPDGVKFYPELPYIAEIECYPGKWNLQELGEYLKSVFDLKFEKITPEENKAFNYAYVHCSDKTQCAYIQLALDNHPWKGQLFRVLCYNHTKKPIKRDVRDGPPDPKKIKLSLNEEAMSEMLIKKILPYKDLNKEERLKLNHLQLKAMCNNYLADLCGFYPKLCGWAKMSLGNNHGYLVHIDELISFTAERKPQDWIELIISKKKNTLEKITLRSVLYLIFRVKRALK